MTSPKQYAREIKDSLVTLVDNYDAQKRAIHNACTGDFSKVNELLADAPEALKKYYTKNLPQHYRIEYLEMQPTKQDIEAWVVEAILWDKRVDATWEALKAMPAEEIAYHISKTATEIIVTDKVISVAGKVVGVTCSTALNKGGQMLDKAMAGAAKVGEYIEQAVVDERKVEIAGTGLKVPENFFKTTEEVVTHSPKMEIVKDVGKGGAKVAKTTSTSNKVLKVNNMTEFFRDIPFGKSIKNSLQKTKKMYKGESIYQITKDIDNKLQKGYHIYLDSFHKDHLEIFNKRGKIIGVLNLDGSINEAKTLSAIQANRKIII